MDSMTLTEPAYKLSEHDRLFLIDMQEQLEAAVTEYNCGMNPVQTIKQVLQDFEILLGLDSTRGEEA